MIRRYIGSGCIGAAAFCLASNIWQQMVATVCLVVALNLYADDPR